MYMVGKESRRDILCFNETHLWDFVFFLDENNQIFDTPTETDDSPAPIGSANETIGIGSELDEVRDACISRLNYAFHATLAGNWGPES